MVLKREVFEDPADGAAVDKLFVEHWLSFQGVLAAERALKIRKFDHDHLGVRAAPLPVTGQIGAGPVGVGLPALGGRPHRDLCRCSLGLGCTGRNFAGQQRVDVAGKAGKGLGTDQQIIGPTAVDKIEAGGAGDAQLLSFGQRRLDPALFVCLFSLHTAVVQRQIRPDFAGQPL